MGNRDKKSSGNMLKGMAVGLMLGAAATVIVANNKKASKKVRNTTETVTDNVTNMLHFK